jgi:hypothetical protein
MRRIAVVDTLKQAAIWIVFAACSAPIWGTLLWELWDGEVRPRLIRRDIIDRAAAAILAEHGDRAEQMAWTQEDRAWRYSDPFKQGCWRRIRKRIEAMRRKREAPQWPPSI